MLEESTAISAKRRLTERTRRLFVLGAAVICTIWALLYLPHLRTAPHWYGDEILTLDIGKALASGELANRAVYCTFFSPNYNYQPGFAWLTGMASFATNGDILGGRLLSSFVGLATALIGFYFVSLRTNPLWGLFFAMLLLGYSQSIIHYRWIYPHNIVGLGVLGATLLLTSPAGPRRDWKIGGFLALGALGHLLAIHATAVSLLCRLKRPKSWLPIALPPALVIFSSLALVWAILGNWLFEDLYGLYENYSRYGRENGAGIKKFLNYYNFLTHDFFHIIAALGCLLCIRKPTYPIAIVGLGLTFLLTQNRQNLPLFYYQAMAVLPVLALATTIGLRNLSKVAGRTMKDASIARTTIPSIAVFIALINCAFSIPKSLKGDIPTRITPWVVSSPADYEITAQWINENTSANDLVIAYWTLGWLLDCKNADILTATAWSGATAGDYYPTVPSRERFRYDVDINKAKYFVLTDLDAWALAQGESMRTVDWAGVQLWPLVFKQGTCEVYQNPRFGKSD